MIGMVTIWPCDTVRDVVLVAEMELEGAVTAMLRIATVSR